LELWAIFHANACSLPPEPNNKIFIFFDNLEVEQKVLTGVSLFESNRVK